MSFPIDGYGFDADVSSLLREVENANRRGEEQLLVQQMNANRMGEEQMIARQIASRIAQQQQQQQQQMISTMAPSSMAFHHNRVSSPVLHSQLRNTSPVVYPQLLLPGLNDILRHHNHHQPPRPIPPPQASLPTAAAISNQYGSSMSMPVDLTESETTTTTTTTTPLVIQKNQELERPKATAPKPKPRQPNELSKGGLKSEFPYILFRALNEGQYPDTLRWSKDGKAFFVDYGNPKILKILKSNFNYKNLSRWLSQLSSYGWRKSTEGVHRGLMYNEFFHRNMKAGDFVQLLRWKKMGPKEKKGLLRKRELDERQRRIEKSEKGKETKTTKATGKRKAAPEARNLQRKKKPPTVAAPKPSQKPPLDEKAKLLRKQIREHRSLNNLFWKWDMWNYPQDLDAALNKERLTSYVVVEKDRIASYVVKGKKVSKAAVASEALDNKDRGGDISHLLCDEELPASVTEGKDEEQTLSELVERIRKDKIKQDKLREIWSKMVIPNVKGKVLPPAKFAKPTAKWKKAKVGDRIVICWRHNQLYYEATIHKQREKTSYFQLVYDDDGAEEWLDLSKETFRILEHSRDMKPSTPRRTNLSRNFTVDTPRKDNRARSMGGTREESGPIQLPDNYAHLAPLVRYSWKKLGLGSEAGAPAYNSYIKNRDNSAPEATALDILNDLRALRSEGFCGIPLQLDHDEHDRLVDFDDKLTNQLRDLQDQLSKDKDAASAMKEFNRALSSVRKVTDTWTVPMVKDNLQTIETQILKLNEQEARIMKKCKQKGIC